MDDTDHEKLKHFVVIKDIEDILLGYDDKQVIVNKIKILLEKRRNVIDLLLGLLNNKTISIDKQINIIETLTDHNKLTYEN